MDALQREFYHAMFPEAVVRVKHGIMYSKYARIKTTRAKKKHQCGICYRDIVINEHYATLALGEGPAPSIAHWKSVKMCMSCELQVFNLLRVKEGHV